MATSYHMAMPIMIFNLGVEMVYVLCSRLKAQSVDDDKSATVIHDVVNSLFDEKFQREIRKKKEVNWIVLSNFHQLGSHSSVKELFDKLAHSSIMRLNSSSMGKLYDLMIMSFKLQLVKTKFAEEIFQVTMNHLNALLEILNKLGTKAKPEIISLVKESIDYVHKVTYGR